MRPMYISTRGGVEPVDFRAAVMMGLADDGGLLIPEIIPNAEDKLEQWSRLSYPELAFEVMRMFVGDSVPEDDLHRIIKNSYATFAAPDIIPVKKVGNIFITELFHGPTLAFKDVALQFLGNMFEYILSETGERLNIIGATSGDTGSAAIHGVRGKAGIDIFIMFPEGRVSPLQERQMTTVPDENVHCIAINGTFDDGQRVLKEIFNDMPFKRRLHLGAVNSVNWARVLAQVVYYFWSAFQVKAVTEAEKIQVSVPTGNFGDIFAGYIAKRMGAPIERLILATNENDILSRFFNTGIYSLGTVQPTISPSMDIQVASNFERYLYYRLGMDSAKVREAMTYFAKNKTLAVPGEADAAFAAGKGDTETTMDTIKRYFHDYGYVLDPHTAVGVSVAEKNAIEGVPTVCLATAHPAKFAITIDKALGEGKAVHPALEALKNLPTRKVLLEPEICSIEGYVSKTLEEKN